MTETPSLDIEDHAQLRSYLRACGRLAQDANLEARTLSGGVSSRAVWVRLPSGAEWVLKQALAKLRVKADWFSDPSRIGREAEGLRACALLAPPRSTPELVFEDAANLIVAMTAVPRPHDNWKQLLLGGHVSMAHVVQFADLLAALQIHSQHQRGSLAARFANRSFFESLRIEPYYSYTAGRVPEAAAFYEQLTADTLARRECFVHGDFSPKNVLVHKDRLVLVDYEVAHWGDPAFDLGFSMTHLLAKAGHVAGHTVSFAQAAQAYWQRYSAAAGPHFAGLEARSIRHTLGCLLARVDGRSPLEYLAEAGRQRQRRTALTLMKHTPETMPALIESFVCGMESQ
jgi:5-methylthioribose kinase